MASDLDRIDIVGVARELGIQVSRSRRPDQTLALCPFHKENTPSLVLFHKRGEAKAHYHCFGCQAHGGILDLIIGKSSAQDYADAFRWLEEHGLLEADGRRRYSRSKTLSESAAVKAFLDAAREKADPALLRTFAESRHFDLEILSAAGVLAVDLRPVAQQLDPDKDESRLLLKLGLIRQTDIPILGQEGDKPGFSPFVAEPRIVIPLRDINGAYVSAMARASRYDQEPKYKFPARFNRGNHLFGIHDEVSKLRVDKRRQDLFFDLYITEGVFDALRLKSIGRHAVACFGASLTQSQVKLIEQMAEIANGVERTLRLHLFFDADRAGRDGTVSALARLMGSAAEKGYLLDVVRPPGGADAPKEDPDSWIVKRQMAGEEIDLDAITHPALHALVASFLDDRVTIENIQDYWHKLSWPEQFALQNRLSRRLGEIDYAAVRNAIRPDLTSLAVATGGPDLPLTELSRDLERLATRRQEPKAKAPPDSSPVKLAPLSTRLQDAIELAMEASNSREYPVDLGSWDRIRKAAMVFLPLLEKRLEEADVPVRPFTAHYVPRSNTKPRLKCGPCPEDAILQQHFLIELLRFDQERNTMDKVPAVRWWPDRRKLETTGRGDENGETVSFGYQIDMSALDGRPDRPRGRRDIFRPFIECWHGYIASIGRRLTRLPDGIVHVARLDIKRFYDEIPRWLIQNKLDGILGTVLSLDSGFGERLGFSLLPHDAQRKRIRDWVLAHSFGVDEDQGYSYIHPLDGRVCSWGRRGRGLPQGPPLSAYLATIALFDLDKRMVAEVTRIDQRIRQAEGRKKTDKLRYGAVYARYVDDIILIASSESDLRTLLACVSEEVIEAGLRLNEKTEVLLPKTIAEAREWLVERRGTGEGYDTGTVEDRPAPVHEAASNWADIPDLDRRHLLAAILDPALDAPELTWEAALQRLVMASKAGGELRENDHAHFSRKLLMRVMLRPDSAVETPADRQSLAELIAKHWAILVSNWRQPFLPDQEDGANERAAHEALYHSNPLLALFDGVERMLMGRPELNPFFSGEAREKLKTARHSFIEALRHGLLDHLRDAVLRGLGAPISLLKAQLAQYQMILEERAEIVWREAGFRSDFDESERISRSLSPLDQLDKHRTVKRDAFWRLEASWYRNFGGRMEGGGNLAFDRSLQSLTSALSCLQDSWRREVPFAALHSSLCVLQALALPSMQNEISENDSRAKGALSTLLNGEGFKATPVNKAVSDVLRIWFGDGAAAVGTDGDDAYKMVVNAAFVFCLILKGADAFASLLLTRKGVISALADDRDANLLPAPPIACGWQLLFRGKDGNLIAVMVDGVEKEEHLPSDFTWQPQPGGNKPIGGFEVERYRATIPDGFAFLYDWDHPKEHDQKPLNPVPYTAEIVDALLERTAREHRSHPETALVLTPYSLLYKVVPDAPTRQVEIKLAAWRIAAEKVQGLAFRRSGKALQIQRTSHSAGDWLWRAGTAVADILSVVSVVGDPADEPAEGASLSENRSSLEAVLRRKLFSRIQGHHLPPTVNAVDLESGGLPRHIRRVLDTLHLAAGQSRDAAVPAIIQHFIEGRAMAVRQSMPSALESVSTGAAGVLVQLGRKSLGRGDELYLNADAPSGRAFGRATEAYRRVAHVLDKLAATATQPDIQKGLRIGAVGVRLWAMTLAWRELALALLARLDPLVRQSLVDMQPELGAWGLEGSVFLVKPPFGWKDADASDFWLQIQIGELRRVLTTAFAASRAVDAHAALDRVTLLGWVVVAGLATTCLPFVPREGQGRAPLAWTPRGTEAEAKALPRKFAELVTVLATGPAAGREDHAGDWPWDLFEALADRTPDVLAEATLGMAARVAGIEWAHPAPEGKVLENIDSLEGRFSYSPKGTAFTLRPGHWRLVHAVMSGDTKSRPESDLTDHDQELQVWTVIQDAVTKDALVISLASDAMIRQSGLERPQAGPAFPGASDADVPAERPDKEHEGTVEPPSDDQESFDSPSPGLVKTEVVAEVPSPATQTGAGGTILSLDNSWENKDSDNNETSIDVDSAIPVWRKLQNRAWRDRRYDPTSTLDRNNFRFAFLQTDFAEGYEDPRVPEGHLTIGDTDYCPEDLCWWSPEQPEEQSEQSEGKPKKPEGKLASRPGLRKLCLDEWRRRQVLMRVIETCETFGVKVLLLPEYSMRPETVLWLAGHLDAKKIPLSVWAGTFRVPSKFQIEVDENAMRGSFLPQGATSSGGKKWNALDAVLPVIFRDDQPGAESGFQDEHAEAESGSGAGNQQDGGSSARKLVSESSFLFNRLPNQLLSRLKQFPALAYEEIFTPPSTIEPFLPIMLASRSISRAESFVTELICSEIFAFNGPTNLEQIASHMLSLHKRLGRGLADSSYFTKIINSHNEYFSNYVSHGIPPHNRPRRTILLLPCITKRAKDYHAFGTTMHLSAGTNIIFCNSTLKDLGGGESCVIGFRSWDDKQNKSKFGPYHGVLPGLYIPGDGEKVKQLDPKERALVIVDMEPFNPALPNPRPQYVPEPVRLIAHLPIIEYQIETVEDWKVLTSKDKKVVAKAAQAATELAQRRLDSTLALAKPEQRETLDRAYAVLKQIQELHPESSALKKRRECFKKEHGGMPEAWPPPVLTDWVPVDLDIRGFKNCVDKQLPSTPPESLDHAGEGPGLPLIWINPP